MWIWHVIYVIRYNVNYRVLMSYVRIWLTMNDNDNEKVIIVK